MEGQLVGHQDGSTEGQELTCDSIQIPQSAGTPRGIEAWWIQGSDEARASQQEQSEAAGRELHSYVGVGKSLIPAHLCMANKAQDDSWCSSIGGWAHSGAIQASGWKAKM